MIYEQSQDILNSNLRTLLRHGFKSQMEDHAWYATLDNYKMSRVYTQLEEALGDSLEKV